MPFGETLAQPIQIVVTPGSGNGGALRTAKRLESALRAHCYPSELLIFGQFAKLVVGPHLRSNLLVSGLRRR
jgi:hypothetical protein